ncbi:MULTISPECIES: hypothetical protein [unclassified Streptomyces]|uniref:hypothetical protein n=1 Tax=unclassified Streptomyces TaxID=2593676 RepID=UPI001D3E0D09|nr:hypothetical protein [Streptomyces sp. MAG02]
MPIDPFAALNAMIRAEAARVRPAGVPAPEGGASPAEGEEEPPRQQRQDDRQTG